MVSMSKLNVFFEATVAIQSLTLKSGVSPKFIHKNWISTFAPKLHSLNKLSISPSVKPRFYEFQIPILIRLLLEFTTQACRFSVISTTGSPDCSNKTTDSPLNQFVNSHS